MHDLDLKKKKNPHVYEQSLNSGMFGSLAGMPLKKRNVFSLAVDLRGTCVQKCLTKTENSADTAC